MHYMTMRTAVRCLRSAAGLKKEGGHSLGHSMVSIRLCHEMCRPSQPRLRGLVKPPSIGLKICVFASANEVAQLSLMMVRQYSKVCS